jgi:phage/plasmid primase-like uncharacterized protein
MLAEITVLMELAGAEEKDEFSEAFGLSEEMRQALKDELDAERKVKMQKAVKKIVQLMKDTKLAKEKQVMAIRSARKAEKAAKQRLDEIERAVQYAQETSNYLPLVRLTQSFSVSEYRGMDVIQSKWKVPEDWKPSAPPPPAE